MKGNGLDAAGVSNISENNDISSGAVEEVQGLPPSPEEARGVCNYNCRQMPGLNRFGGGAQAVGQEFPLPDKQTTLMMLNMALIMANQGNIDFVVNSLESFLNTAGVRNYPEIPRDPEAIRALIGRLMTIVQETNSPAEGMRRLAAEAPGIIADLQNQDVSHTPSRTEAPVDPPVNEPTRKPARTEPPVEEPAPEVASQVVSNEAFGISQTEEDRFIASLNELGGTYGLFNPPRIPSKQERLENEAIHRKLKQAAESGYVDPDVAEAYRRNKAQMEVNFNMARTYKGHKDAPTSLPDDPAEGIIVLYNYFKNHISD